MVVTKGGLKNPRRRGKHREIGRKGENGEIGSSFSER